MPLGRTGLDVTQFGLGTAALGLMYEPVADEAALATVQRAYDLDVRFFDTSPLYGAGLAETRAGVVLRELPRDSFVLSDKLGHVIVDGVVEGRDYSYDGTLRLFEQSLARSGLDRIDIELIHDPEDYMEAAIDGAYRALRELRNQGVVRAIGAGMNFSDKLTWLAHHGEFDCFLLAGRYTLLDQSALDDLLPEAVRQGIAIYIGGPFNSGILANPYAATATFNYAPADQAWVKKARKIDAVCQEHEVPLKAAALQFPLGHSAVVSVLSGARSIGELEENLAMFRHPIPAALWDDLRSAGLLDERAPTPIDS
ncbi:MAG: aldo/keto reductase [Roseiflexaceae bacterium]|nr:aldo/keto reductase [Roseiflexaceae bacterium]